MDALRKDESERLVQRAYAEAFAEGVSLGKARFRAIMSSEKATFNRKLALHLALKTDLAADDAIGCLAAASEDHPSPAIISAMAGAAAVSVLQ